MKKIRFDKNAQAVLIIMISIVCYGIFTGFQKSGLEEIPDPFEFGAYTMIWCSIFLFPGAFYAFIKSRKDDTLKSVDIKVWLFLIGLSIFVQFGAASIKLGALKYTTATSVGFIASFSSLFLTTYAVLISKEKLPKGFIWVLILMIFGLIVFRTKDNFTFAFGIGEILALTFVNMTSISHTFSKNQLKGSLSPQIISFGRMFFSIPFLLLAAVISGQEVTMRELFSLWPILTGIAFSLRILLLYIGMGLTKLQNIAVLNILAPIVTTTYGFAVLGEKFGVLQIVGEVIILGGVYLIYRLKKRDSLIQNK